MQKLVHWFAAVVTSLGVLVTLFAVSQSFWTGKGKLISGPSSDEDSTARPNYGKNAPQQVVATELGCVGDGEHDDTAALQRLINEHTDRQILLPAGRYKITKPLVVVNSAQIVGDGTDHTEIIADATGAMIFTTTSEAPPQPQRRRSVIQGISFKAAGKTVASSTAIQFLTREDIAELNHVRIAGFDIGVVAKDFAQLKVSNTQILGAIETSLHIESDSPNSEATISRTTIESASKDTAPQNLVSVGVEVLNVKSLIMDHMQVRGGSIGLRFRPNAAKSAVRAVSITNSQWTNQQLNGIVIDQQMHLVESIKFKDVSVESAGQDGVLIRGSPSQSLLWKGGTIRFNGGHGFRLERVTQISIEEAHVLQNSRKNRNMFHGVSISSHSNNVTISDSQIENLEDDDSGQLYGVYVVGSNNHSIHLEGNRWSSNGSPCPFAQGCSTYLGKGVYAVTGTGNVPEIKFSNTARSPASLEVSTGPKAQPISF